MAARDYDIAEAKPMPEPLHERVLVLEKQLREMREELEEHRALLNRANRELGLDRP